MTPREMTVEQLVFDDETTKNAFGYFFCAIHESHIQELNRREEERLRLLKEMQEIVEMLDCHPNNVLHSIRDLLDRLGE